MIETTGQTALVSSAIIAGKPWTSFVVDVVSIEGDLLTYTTDRVWLSTASRSEFSAWDLLVDHTPEGITSAEFVAALNLTAVTPVPDLSAYGWPFYGPGWEAFSPEGEVRAFGSREAAHAWRLSSVRAYLGAVPAKVYSITRDGQTTTATELPADMPAVAKDRLAVLGVVFYGAGAVKVTDESGEFWLVGYGK